MNLRYKEKCYANMLKNSGTIPGKQRQVFKWNMLNSSGNTPENTGQVLKYLLLKNAIELPEADYTRVWRKKRRCCYLRSVRLFLSLIYLIVLEKWTLRKTILSILSFLPLKRVETLNRDFALLLYPRNLHENYCVGNWRLKRFYYNEDIGVTLTLFYFCFQLFH